jgi:hypothetical protein
MTGFALTTAARWTALDVGVRTRVSIFTYIAGKGSRKAAS